MREKSIGNWRDALIEHLYGQIRLTDDGPFSDFLDQLGTKNIEHSNRSLKDHLLGTCVLLRRWGNPEEVCIAGLFHSIYGTELFSPQAVSRSKRGQIQSVIGRKSEQLAYLFGVADRKKMLLDNVREPYKVEIAGSVGISIPVSPEVLSGLIEIEVANTLELIRAPSIPDHLLDLFVGMRNYFDDQKAVMSEGARSAYPFVLDFYEHVRLRRKLT